MIRTRISALFFALAFSGTLTAAAATLLFSGAAIAGGDMTFTGPEIAQLLKATQDIDTSPDIDLDVVAKTSAQMPSYDPIIHYVGLVPNGKPHEATLWMLENFDGTTPAGSKAFRGGLELACMDTGDAGPKWKALYDQMAAADDKLDPTVGDRYYNRHFILTGIQNLIDNMMKADDVSPSPTPARERPQLFLVDRAQLLEERQSTERDLNEKNGA
ncbi:MAG TPA: hypothetical protein VMS32_02280 [Verrucomicrobiae bacterium]|jgi:hypothetical protein|nr:hypothetical protein [Verrucomicrobiae bacterium]